MTAQTKNLITFAFIFQYYIQQDCLFGGFAFIRQDNIEATGKNSRDKSLTTNVNSGKSTGLSQILLAVPKNESVQQYISQSGWTHMPLKLLIPLKLGR